MYPYLYRTPWFFIYSYTAVFVTGILISLSITARINRKLPVPNWVDGWLAGMTGAILGGRLGFIGVSWAYYQERPSELGLWRGGISYHAAFICGILVLWVWCGARKRPLLTHLNLFAPALALISAFGWFACWLEGCAYGAETVLGPFAADLPDAFGVFAVRYQTQWLGVGSALLIFIWALWQIKRRKTNTLFGWVLFGVSLSHLSLTFLRGDPVTMLGSFRIDTLLDGILVLISPILLKYGRNTVVTK